MIKAVRYTSHAMVILRERELDSDWIERAIRHPDWVEVDPGDASVSRYFVALPERGGRHLRVAAVEMDGTYLILTAFLDRRARPK